MEQSIKDFANHLAEDYIEERDRAYNALIRECCYEIVDRLEAAIKNGVTGADFSVFAKSLVNDAAEAIEQCDGGRVGKDFCDILPQILERLSALAPYRGQVRVDVKKQTIEFHGEEMTVSYTTQN